VNKKREESKAAKGGGGRQHSKKSPQTLVGGESWRKNGFFYRKTGESRNMEKETLVKDNLQLGLGKGKDERDRTRGEHSRRSVATTCHIKARKLPARKGEEEEPSREKRERMKQDTEQILEEGAGFGEKAMYRHAYDIS